MKLIIMLLALSLFGNAFAGDSVKGAGKYSVCTGCHGSSGEGSAKMGYPRLAGQSQSQIKGHLLSFKNGSRNNATMKVFANMLSYEDIENVSAYIATFK